MRHPGAAALLCVLGCASAAPNILLFFPDELRYDWGGTASSPFFTPGALPLRTPHIDAIARRGVRFTRAFVPTPVCAPSRACLASGREYDAAGQGKNAISVADDNTFAVGTMPTFYQVLQEAGYWTMVAGRDDLTKRTGPGARGEYHSTELGFNDSARCAGSVDVTWGECRGTDGGALPCAGAMANQSASHPTVHEPYGTYLSRHTVSNASIAARYNASNYFELDFQRYAELNRRGPYDSVDWYAIPDTLPFEQRHYQDDWIARQAVRLISNAPVGSPWFIEISHQVPYPALPPSDVYFQAPHPPMDITAAMEASMAGRDTNWPLPYQCPNASSLCSDWAAQRMRRNYAAKIERLDVLLGRYIAAVEARGESNTTWIFLASDHGEMLGDRGATAKSKPWASAMSVPMVAAGPGVRGAVVHLPVATVDLAATFIEIADGRKPPLMSSTSLLPLIRNPALPRAPRSVVHSGLANFRVVVVNVNSTAHLKLICCVGQCPGATAGDMVETKRRGSRIEVHLFNVAGRAYEQASGSIPLRFEDPVSDMAIDHAHDTTLLRLAELLPAANTKKSYDWHGCNMSEWVTK